MPAEYFNKLSDVQKQNISVINQQMVESGITNPYTRAAILAVASKESGFIPQSEKSYKNTSNDRLRSIFSSLSTKSDAELNALKQDDVNFFNTVYGGKYGNAANEGYKYRGRAFNQLTFKDNYASIGKRIGVDLVNNPDKANEVDTAAKILIDYFIREFNTAKKLGLLAQYNTSDLNGFKTAKDSLNAVFQANRGWGKKGKDTTGGFDLAKDRYNGFYSFVSNHKATIGGSFFFDTNNNVLTT